MILPLYGQLSPLGRKYAGAAQVSYLTDLVSYWTHDETGAGTRFDSHGANDATDIFGTMTHTAGQIGNASLFSEAGLTGLSVSDADNSLDGGAQNFVYVLWFKTAAVPTTFKTFFTKAFNMDHGLFLDTLGRLHFTFANTYAVQSAGAVNDGVFHQGIVWHDLAAQTINVVVDDGPVQTTGGVVTYTTNNDEFRFGLNITVTDIMDGAIDEVGRWNLVPDAAWRSGIYNGGVGLTYASF